MTSTIVKLPSEAVPLREEKSPSRDSEYAARLKSVCEVEGKQSTLQDKIEKMRSRMGPLGQHCHKDRCLLDEIKDVSTDSILSKDVNAREDAWLRMEALAEEVHALRSGQARLVNMVVALRGEHDVLSAEVRVQSTSTQEKIVSVNDDVNRDAQVVWDNLAALRERMDSLAELSVEFDALTRERDVASRRSQQEYESLRTTVRGLAHMMETLTGEHEAATTAIAALRDAQQEEVCNIAASVMDLRELFTFGVCGQTVGTNAALQEFQVGVDGSLVTELRADQVRAQGIDAAEFAAGLTLIHLLWGWHSATSQRIQTLEDKVIALEACRERALRDVVLQKCAFECTLGAFARGCAEINALREESETRWAPSPRV
mmetsp:Transcript_33283/g.89095  ORF Transcript_33283/g.89095 Transcript_33283/m.89095 type:complete len:373 (-) Transcript_33283:512-1630(-)